MRETETVGQFEICSEAFAAINDRLDALEQNHEGVWRVIRKVSEDVAYLRGRIAGYVIAGTLLSGIVAVVAEFLLQHVALGK